jgi:hypothetical protein
LGWREAGMVGGCLEVDWVLVVVSRRLALRS